MLAKSRLKRQIDSNSHSNVTASVVIAAKTNKTIKTGINNYINAPNLLFFSLFIIFLFISINILNNYSPTDIKDLFYFNSFLPIVITIFISFASLFTLIFQNFARGILTAMTIVILLYFKINNVIFQPQIWLSIIIFYSIFFFIFRKKIS